MQASSIAALPSIWFRSRPPVLCRCPSAGTPKSSSPTRCRGSGSSSRAGCGSSPFSPGTTNLGRRAVASPGSAVLLHDAWWLESAPERLHGRTRGSSTSPPHRRSPRTRVVDQSARRLRRLAALALAAQSAAHSWSWMRRSRPPPRALLRVEGSLRRAALRSSSSTPRYGSCLVVTMILRTPSARPAGEVGTLSCPSMSCRRSWPRARLIALVCMFTPAATPRAPRAIPRDEGAVARFYQVAAAVTAPSRPCAPAAHLCAACDVALPSGCGSPSCGADSRRHERALGRLRAVCGQPEQKTRSLRHRSSAGGVISASFPQAPPPVIARRGRLQACRRARPIRSSSVELAGSSGSPPRRAYRDAEASAIP